MTSNVLDGVIVPAETVRDFIHTLPGADASFIYDIQNTGNSLGLDVFIRNRGAAALTVDMNGTGAITVDPGDVYIVNNTKFWLIEVVSFVLYDLQLFGIRVNTLKRMGLYKPGEQK